MVPHRRDNPGCLVVFLMFALAVCAHALPELSRGGFVPIENAEHEVIHEGIEVIKQDLSDHYSKDKEMGDEGGQKKDAKPRLGTTTVAGGNIELGLTLTAPFLNIPLTTGANEYEGTTGHLVPGAYAPLNYDLGGLVLAGAMALGTIFLLPKFLPPANRPQEFFTDGGYPNHGRVDDIEKLKNVSDTTNNFASILSRLDESLLSNYQVDTTACAYRIICSAVQTAKDGVSNGKPTAIDSFIHVLTKMPILRTYLPPTWKDIADTAWTTDKINTHNAVCDDTNMLKRCPVNPEIAKMVLRTLFPSSGIV